MYIYIYICTYIYMYIYTHINTHTHTHCFLLVCFPRFSVSTFAFQHGAWFEQRRFSLQLHTEDRGKWSPLPPHVLTRRFVSAAADGISWGWVKRTAGPCRCWQHETLGLGLMSQWNITQLGRGYHLQQIWLFWWCPKSPTIGTSIPSPVERSDLPFFSF